MTSAKLKDTMSEHDAASPRSEEYHSDDNAGELAEDTAGAGAGVDATVDVADSLLQAHDREEVTKSLHFLTVRHDVVTQINQERAQAGYVAAPPLSNTAIDNTAYATSMGVAAVTAGWRSSRAGGDGNPPHDFLSVYPLWFGRFLSLLLPLPC